MTQNHDAQGFIDTDRTAAKNDVLTMGRRAAARYCVAIAKDNAKKGDTRWADLTQADMMAVYASEGWRKARK